MRSFILLLVTVVGVSVSVPIEENEKLAQINALATRNSAIEQVIIDLLEDVRNVVLNGSDDIAALDPLDIPSVDLDLGILGFAGSAVSATNVVVKNLGTFVVNDVTVTLAPIIIIGRSSLLLDLEIPSLEARAENYDLEINISGLRVFGNGEADVTIIRPRITARVEFNILITLSIRLQSADVRIHLDEFKPVLTGVFDGDEVLNEFVNDFLEVFVPEALQYFEDDISNFINPLVVQIGNQILENVNIGDLLPI